VIERGVRRATVSVWIATANLKDVHVEAPVGTRARAAGKFTSLFDELGEAARRGVEVRVLHAGPPSGPLAKRLAGRGAAAKVALRRCVRMHSKIIVVDGAMLYLGSANFTGAGLGAKAEGRRNFEVGIVTSDELVMDRLQEEFDEVWSGKACASCKLRRECPKPIDTLIELRSRAARPTASAGEVTAAPSASKGSARRRTKLRG
jgi:phosphatidylserine/phosphatidylglycerophosphate/cardiolipin synthase-like enzyme